MIGNNALTYIEKNYAEQLAKLGDDYKVVVKTYLHTDEDGKHNLVDMLND